MRVYCYCPETGVYQGEDFLEECLLDCVEGVTKLAPPQYSRGLAPVYDKTLHCWNLIELTGKSVTHQMDKT